jgi:hypothetical protein
MLQISTQWHMPKLYNTMRKAKRNSQLREHVGCERKHILGTNELVVNIVTT